MIFACQILMQPDLRSKSFKNGISKRILKIQEAAWLEDENLFEIDVSRLSYFSSVVEGSFRFSYIIFVSLAFFGSFLGNAKKNESLK